ncbi:MAG: hypothetical protein AAB263_08215 [Planctomycetota bacterium]
MITGRVAYLCAFDIAHDVPRPWPTRLLGCDLKPWKIESGKRVPRTLSFDRPLSAVLPNASRRLANGEMIQIDRVVRLLPIGALSVVVLVPFRVEQLSDLVVWHDLSLDGRPVYDEITALATEALSELRPHLIRPVERLEDGEAYTVFCVDSASMGGFDGPPWLETNRRMVASLLTQEENEEALSSAEVDESTTRWVSYYRRDLTVVDWDAALLVDEAPALDDALLVLEVANVELTELECYDRMLDRAVAHCYPDIGGSWTRSRGEVVRELGEISVDLARMQDELENASKFHGDFHLARIHRLATERFHLHDWQHTVESKLRTVDGIYQHLKSDLNARWMLVLEIAIVLLFIIDVILIFAGPR